LLLPAPLKFGVIVDVEPFRGIRQAEVGAAKTMIDRTEQRFGLKREQLAGDTKRPWSGIDRLRRRIFRRRETRIIRLTK
jgi:hypothetical protein